MKPQKFFITGLGSMGKRRIRCLNALGFREITGYDPLTDRRDEAREKYGIHVVSDPTKISMDDFDALIISTPPDQHLVYLEHAIRLRKPAFVEASVILTGLEEIDKKAREKGVLIAPSATLCFHPAIQEIKRIVESGKYGKLANFTYHSGNFLPDWHPWETPLDFYVSKKETGGCREIVPFELTWICDVLGFPKKARGFFGQTTEVGADIDDTYAIALMFEHGIGALLVDVVCRPSTRQLILNLERAQILWNWENHHVDLYEVDQGRWVRFQLKQGEAHPGYNKNITEDMYIREIENFVRASAGEEKFFNDLTRDMKVLQVLCEIERNSL